MREMTLEQSRTTDSGLRLYVHALKWSVPETLYLTAELDPLGDEVMAIFDVIV
jgi:hypothetical protein